MDAEGGGSDGLQEALRAVAASATRSESSRSSGTKEEPHAGRGAGLRSSRVFSTSAYVALSRVSRWTFRLR
jgi:hypothetical protein